LESGREAPVFDTELKREMKFSHFEQRQVGRSDFSFSRTIQVEDEFLFSRTIQVGRNDFSFSKDGTSWKK